MANINWITVLLLIISNFVMAYAWYGNLRQMEGLALWKIILISWAIALLEYVFMIPANRIGAKTMSLMQLKITQEAISLLVFAPMRFAGIMKTYSSSAIAQLIKMIFQSARPSMWRKLPYQAYAMTKFEMMSRRTVIQLMLAIS